MPTAVPASVEWEMLRTREGMLKEGKCPSTMRLESSAASGKPCARGALQHDLDTRWRSYRDAVVSMHASTSRTESFQVDAKCRDLTVRCKAEARVKASVGPSGVSSRQSSLPHGQRAGPVANTPVASTGDTKITRGATPAVADDVIEVSIQPLPEVATIRREIHQLERSSMKKRKELDTVKQDLSKETTSRISASEEAQTAEAEVKRLQHALKLARSMIRRQEKEIQALGSHGQYRDTSPPRPNENTFQPPSWEARTTTPLSISISLPTVSPPTKTRRCQSVPGQVRGVGRPGGDALHAGGVLSMGKLATPACIPISSVLSARQPSGTRIGLHRMLSRHDGVRSASAGPTPLASTLGRDYDLPSVESKAETMHSVPSSLHASME